MILVLIVVVLLLSVLIPSLVCRDLFSPLPIDARLLFVPVLLALFLAAVIWFAQRIAARDSEN